MDQALTQISLYDLTGYLMPGLVVVWSLIYVSNAVLRRQKKNHVKPSMFALIITGYIAGHLLQALAAVLERLLSPIFELSLFWRPLDQLYANDSLFRDALKGAIKNAFAGIGQDQPFTLCQTYVQIHGIDAHTDIMQARYGLFRGLALALFISGCAFAVEWFLRRGLEHRRRVLIMTCLLLLTSALSFQRMIKFEYYYVNGIYRTFYVHVMSRPTIGTPQAPH